MLERPTLTNYPENTLKFKYQISCFLLSYRTYSKGIVLKSIPLDMSNNDLENELKTLILKLCVL